MKFVFKLFLALFTSIPCFGQGDTMIDHRDGQSYRVVELNGKNWMIDDLNYESTYSLKHESEEGSGSEIEGRFYSFFETESICPHGWSLPNRKDWSNYFQFMYDSLNVESAIQESKKRYPAVIHKFVEFEGFDLFAEHNPIALQENYMIEGGELKKTFNTANYWAINEDEEYKNKTHVHITKNALTIHSHKGHLQRKKPKKMRMFLVRCVGD